MEPLLLELLRRLEAIEDAHPEVVYPDVMAAMDDAVSSGFIWAKQEDALPNQYGMFSAEGDRLVKEALASFIEGAGRAAPALGLDTPEQRLAAFRDPCVQTERGSQAFDYFDLANPNRPGGGSIVHRELSPRTYGPEWRELWDRFVPEEGQADTVQGELLRDAARLRGQYGNNGLGNWSPTYEAFVETLLRHLGDGTFDPEATAFIRRVLESARAYGRRQIPRERAPDAGEVDRACDYAVLWCLHHPDAVSRLPDARMEF